MYTTLLFSLVLLSGVLTQVWSQANNLFQLDPYGDDSIRIRIAPSDGSITEPPLQALIGTPPAKTTAHVYSADSSTLTNGNLRVSIDPATSFITATRVSDGVVLLQQTALTFDTPNVPTTRLGSVSSLVTFAGVTGEKIYGLGEHSTGKVNQMPYSKRFADSQDYHLSHGSDVSIPWYASSLGYGFVWNSAAYGFVDLSEASKTWFSNASLGVDMWVTTTSDAFDPATGVSPYADLLSHYVDAVGHASLMPYYSTGFIQCKDRYRNQTQLLDVARGYIERQLPISTIVIDWQHWTAQGDWHLNPLCWPDPQGMVDELTTMGIELMITFWPFQTPGSRYWDEFVANSYLVNVVNATTKTTPYDGSEQTLIDQTNPLVRQVVFEKFWEGYGKFGVKTVWIDAAEPEHFGSAMEGQWKHFAGTDGEVGEAFIQAHAKSFAEGFATKGITPNDYFILPRHAWAGSWRYSAALWSGDIQSSFSELINQVKVVQGLMMSGPSLWTSDIGGYFGGDPDDPVFQELIVRWFQFGAFCPLFRLHGHRSGGPPTNECGPTNNDNEVWNLAKEPGHYNSIVTVMRLREELREYVSQINAQAASTGMPMLRPMFLQFPLDPACATGEVEDQFMFGPTWLVAPVTVYQATSRSVYLPPLNASTQEWVYYYNYSSVGAGGGRFDVATPIGEFPLFFIRPITPPAPPPTANATFLYSALRGDSVLCLSPQCYSANSPGQDGAYASVGVEGVGLTDSSGSVEVGGVTYPTTPLTLWYSFHWQDNAVSTNSTPPDATYSAGTVFQNGYVLAAPAPGSSPIEYYFKRFNATSQDYSTVAAGSPEAQWCQQRGYTDITAQVPIKGWFLPTS